jgi:hypothetical protein
LGLWSERDDQRISKQRDSQPQKQHEAPRAFLSLDMHNLDVAFPQLHALAGLESE